MNPRKGLRRPAKPRCERIAQRWTAVGHQVQTTPIVPQMTIDKMIAATRLMTLRPDSSPVRRTLRSAAKLRPGRASSAASHCYASLTLTLTPGGLRCGDDRCFGAPASEKGDEALDPAACQDDVQHHDR